VTARALNDTIVFAPPLIIDAQQVDEVLGAFSRALDCALAQLREQGRFA